MIEKQPVYDIRSVSIPELFRRFANQLEHPRTAVDIGVNDPNGERVLRIITEIKSYAWECMDGFDLTENKRDEYPEGTEFASKKLPPPPPSIENLEG